MFFCMSNDGAVSIAYANGRWNCLLLVLVESSHHSFNTKKTYFDGHKYLGQAVLTSKKIILPETFFEEKAASLHLRRNFCLKAGGGSNRYTLPLCMKCPAYTKSVSFNYPTGPLTRHRRKCLLEKLAV
jgi:hypothetical protein